MNSNQTNFYSVNYYYPFGDVQRVVCLMMSDANKITPTLEVLFSLTPVHLYAQLSSKLGN